MKDDGRTGGGAQATDGGVATAGGAVVGQWQDPGCCRTPGVMSLLHALGHRQVGMAPGVWARGAGLEAYLGQGWAVPPHACGSGQRRPNLTPADKQAVGGQEVSAVDLGVWWTGSGAAALIRRARTARGRRRRRGRLHGRVQASLPATTRERAQIYSAPEFHLTSPCRCLVLSEFQPSTGRGTKNRSIFSSE